MTESSLSAAPDTAAAGANRPDAPTPRRRIPYWLCVPIAMAMMVANYVGYLLIQLVLGLVKYKPGWTGNAIVGIIGGLLIFATAIFFAWLLARYLLRTTLRGIGWTWSRDSWWTFLVGWAMATLAIVAGTVLARLVRPSEFPPAENVATGMPVWAIALGIVSGVVAGLIMQGIPEELLFRGWLMHCLASRPRLSLVVSAIAFGLMHFASKGGQENFGERLIYVGQAMAFAFLAGAIALKLHSLWAAVGVHAGMHLTNLLLSMTPFAANGPVTWTGQIIVYVGIALAILLSWKGTRVVMDR